MLFFLLLQLASIVPLVTYHLSLNKQDLLAMDESCILSILSKIGEYLLEPALQHFRYLFCFRSIVEDLKKESRILKLMQDGVEHDVDKANRNAEEIKKEVESWLNDVNNVMTDVQKLENESRVDERHFYRLCPNWCWQYRLGKEATEKKTIITWLRENGRFNQVSYRATLPGIELFSSRDFVLFEATKLAFKQIMELLEDTEINIISLYGMGGIGKTTLVKEVGKKAKELKLFDSVVMAVVSQAPDLRKVQGQLADLLGLKFEEESEQGRASRLCSRLMNERNTLIVLDDVWTNLNLASIGIPFGDEHRGCKILLTTRRQQVWSQRKVSLDFLSEEEGHAFLKKSAGICDASPTLNKVAMEISRECKGLPIAIVTVARALRDKTLNEWKTASRQLKMSRPVDIEGVDQDVYACLKLSYDYLKGEETKLCFLFCSVFPEDYAIDVEDIARYGMGIGLCHDVESIEDAREQVRVKINNLKASCLLLDTDHGEQFVKMHDMVRDVALWIASKGENIFMVRAGIGLKVWPKKESFEHYTAISLMANSINRFPEGLECPKLKMLLLGENDGSISFSDACFEGFGALKVLDLSNWYLYSESTFSLPNSLQFLTKLRTLYLKNRNLGDISMLGKLKNLEILSFYGSEFVELPKDIGDLNNLRLLDLSNCQLERIPFKVIQGLSQLEELYTGSSSFTQWEVEGMSAKRSNASLSELTSLSNLAILSLSLENFRCLPKDFCFPNMSRYDISMDCSSSEYPTSRTLNLRDTDASSLKAFKNLLPRVKYLTLNNGVGFQNIIPHMDQGGLNELTSLRLEFCSEIKCLTDATQWIPTAAFSNLAILYLHEMGCLTTLCYGVPPKGFLQKLQMVEVRVCAKMCTIFPAYTLQTLNDLEEVIVFRCHELQEVFQLERLDTEEENLLLLSSLKRIKLYHLPKLRCIWNGPTQLVSLLSLTILEVNHCTGLRNLFSPFLAQSLVQLEILKLFYCEELEQIITEKNEGEEMSSKDLLQPVCFPKLRILWLIECNKLDYILPISITQGLLQLEELSISGATQLRQVWGGELEILGDGKDVLLPQLRILKLLRLPNIDSFFPRTYYSMWASLQELEVVECPKLMPSIIDDREATEQAFGKKLRVLKLKNFGTLSNEVLFHLMKSLPNLEELTVEICELEEVFKLDVLAGQKNEMLLSSLKELNLVYLPKLRCIWTGPLCAVSLHNLKSLQLTNCKILRHIFSPNLAQSLWQLESLVISGCEELEQIITKDEGDQIFLNGNLQPICFPKLSSIEVIWCNKLKSLFPVNIAQGLQHLGILKVMGASQLEVVFGNENGEIGDANEIILPKLKCLQLIELPSLINFCPGSHQFIMPFLEDLQVEECPKMKTSFIAASD